MVSGTLKLKQLISWHVMYEIVSEDGEIFIYYYPSSDVMLKIKLDKASIELLKKKRQIIIDFLEQKITLSGDIEERWEKQIIHKEEDIEEWVQVT